MKTFLLELPDKEFNYILEKLKENGINFTEQQLKDNLSQCGEIKNTWEIRLSRVSLKDLPKHDNRYFTDGNHNGKSILIPFSENNN